MPITSYVCTQPYHSTFSDHNQCSVSSGLRTCETKEGTRPNLLDGDAVGALGVYVWISGTNPFVVLDIPQGWCVGSVKMTFLFTVIPTPSLSVHSAERLSNNTDRSMFQSVRKESHQFRKRVLMNLTTLACGKYLRINMTDQNIIFLAEIEVFNTSKRTLTEH